ncbi:MAG: C1 family peptidase, partial [Euryarchaeota archaeon]|nr:C1 family peptidase [Euryarchaeota archaeon]
MKRMNHILITAMVLVAVGMFANADIPPASVGLDNDTGNYWVNYTWSKDLGCPDNDNVTDSFNVSMNGTWYNGTATLLNKSVGPGGWANITVWAYNRTGNGNVSVGSVSDNVQAPAMVDPPDDNLCTIMHPDSETLREWIESYNAAPKVNISGEGVMALPDAYSVLGRLDYNATERNQGSCGNCWVWAATGCMEVAHDVENDVFDRLSIQYLNSLYYDGTGDGYACEGGNLDMFVDFYSVNTTFAIPWNHTNASWQDGGGGTSTTVPADSISTTPHYTITRIEETTITTQGVGDTTAIDNIKSVLASDNAIWFAFYLPTDSDWAVFQTFWNNNAETDLWSPDYSCGHTWEEPGGGGHAVLCVGYNDTDPNNRYWIMLNSWGASANRPNGLFRMNM